MVKINEPFQKAQEISCRDGSQTQLQILSEERVLYVFILEHFPLVITASRLMKSPYCLCVSI